MSNMAAFGRVRAGSRDQWVSVRGGEVLPLGAPPWESAEPAPGSQALDPASLEWLAPVVPSKVIGVGRNYALHAREHGADVPAEPLLFLKAPSSLLAPGGDVVLPPESSRVELEGEWAVVLSCRVRRFPADGDPRTVLLGHLLANDVTARDLQRADGQWARGKSFDTFCPLARLVSAVAPQPGAILSTRLNGETVQQAPLTDMVFGLAALLAHASAAMTLEPGDVILTGTPAGVTALAPGDRVEVRLEGLETLAHGVQAGT